MREGNQSVHQDRGPSESHPVHDGTHVRRSCSAIFQNFHSRLGHVVLCGSWSVRLVPRRRTCIVIVVVVGWGSSPTCRCGTRRASGRGRWCSGRFQKQKVYYQSDEGKHQRHKVRKQLLLLVFYGGHDSPVIVRRRKQSVKKSFPSSLCLCVFVCVALDAVSKEFETLDEATLAGCVRNVV